MLSESIAYFPEKIKYKTFPLHTFQKNKALCAPFANILKNIKCGNSANTPFALFFGNV